VEAGEPMPSRREDTGEPVAEAPVRHVDADDAVLTTSRRYRQVVRDIINNYDDPIIRTYARVRFLIFRQIFLEEIGQYLPRSGRILDLGCGFGHFSLFFASLAPDRIMVGVDRNEKRIELARASAKKLGLDNVEYWSSDVLEWNSDETFDAIYLLDLIHHMPRDEVPDFLRRLRSRLNKGGILLVKDIENRPWWKVGFTLLLDRLMVGMEPIHYWAPSEMISMLKGLGFSVAKHCMKDFLPYPHVIYICKLED